MSNQKKGSGEVKETRDLRKLYMLRTAGFLVVFILALLVANITLNYVIRIITSAADSLKNLTASGTPGGIDFGFRSWYLYRVASPAPAWLPFLLAGVVVVFRGWWFVKKIEQLAKNKRLDYSPDDIEGSARWAKPDEIKKILKTVPKNNIESAEMGGIILYEDEDNYYIDDKTCHSLVIGKTRSGKGMYFVLPTIRVIAASREKPSMVIMDPKLENYEYMYETLVQYGYTIWLLNFRDPEMGMSCSDMTSIIREYKLAMETDPEDRDFSRTSDRVSEFARILTANPKSDPIWPESACELLQAIIFYLLEVGYNAGTIDQLNMYTVRNFLIEKGTDTYALPDKTKITALDMLMQKLPPQHPARLRYGTSKFAEGEMRASIFSTLANNLEIYDDTGIARLTTMRAEEPMDFQDLGKADKPIALFLGIPDDRENRHKMAITYIQQIYAELADLSQHSPRNLLPRRVFIVADEIGTMPAIQNLDSKLQVSLGRGIVWYLFAQNKAQFKKIYGENETRIIQDAATNFVYILSSDLDTNKEVAEMLGASTKAFQTTTGDHGSIIEADHVQSHLKGRQLRMSDELRMMQEGEVIVIRDRTYPMHSLRTPFYELGIRRLSIEKTNYTKARRLAIKDLLMPYNPEPAAKAAAKGKPASAGKDPMIPASAKKRLQICQELNKITKGQYSRALSDGDMSLAQSIALEQYEIGGISSEDFAILQNYFAVDG
jgi:type IV secretion system protein VirD4